MFIHSRANSSVFSAIPFYVAYSIRVCRDAVTRRSLGYAYVNYLNGADGESSPNIPLACLIPYPCFRREGLGATQLFSYQRPSMVRLVPLLFSRRSSLCCHPLTAASCGRSAIRLSAKPDRVISSSRTWMRLLTTRYVIWPETHPTWSLIICSLFTGTPRYVCRIW